VEDTVHDSQVVNKRKGENLSLAALGNFERHHDESGRAYQKREVAKLCKQYERSVALDGLADCEETVSSSVLVRGFLQEGAAPLACNVQLQQLSEELLHFWDELPPRHRWRILRHG
jgi:hypothetical protein